ncbi:class I SAM-dependent methyltransferase [Kribbella sp. NPDC006257]|uniref:class I SAM-dependent methyltransferase n=1 Tax=Kribbella sp. NPDC006257 TaxID=3156738 RepID=UPI0033AD1232
MSVYDDPVFLAGYRGLRRDGLGLNSALEIPALTAMLPPVGGLRVVDLGCGEGELAVRIAAAGAASVTGVDLSASMLSRAREHVSVRYVQADIADFDLPAGSVDLVVSSLALHYVEDFDGLVARIARWLSAGGRFVFSIEHPVITAPLEAADLVIDDYFDEGLRQRSWFVDGVQKYHRTVSSLLMTLCSRGFSLLAVDEPQPTATQVESHPHLAIHRRRPALLLVAAARVA